MTRCSLMVGFRSVSYYIRNIMGCRLVFNDFAVFRVFTPVLFLLLVNYFCVSLLVTTECLFLLSLKLLHVRNFLFVLISLSLSSIFFLVYLEDLHP